jgi:WD40 repeat protein
VLRVLDLRRGVAPRAVEAGPRRELAPGEGILPGIPPVKVGLISDVEFTGDGAYVLTRDDEGVSQWDVRSLVRVRQYSATGATAQALAPDGKSIAIAHDDAVISVFDTTTGEKLRSSKGGGLGADCLRGRMETLSVGSRIGGLGWSLDGKTVYALYRESATLVGFDAQTFALGNGGCAHNNRINAVALVGRARHGGDRRRHAHDLAVDRASCRSATTRSRVLLAGEMPGLHRFRGHELAVLGVDFSPDGKLLATAGADRTARLWDLKGGGEVATIRGHAAEVDSAAFSHDNKFLATASYDLTMKVWDVAATRRTRSSSRRW